MRSLGYRTTRLVNMCNTYRVYNGDDLVCMLDVTSRGINVYVYANAESRRFDPIEPTFVDDVEQYVEYALETMRSMS